MFLWFTMSPSLHQSAEGHVQVHLHLQEVGQSCCAPLLPHACKRLPRMHVNSPLECHRQSNQRAEQEKKVPNFLKLLWPSAVDPFSFVGKWYRWSRGHPEPLKQKENTAAQILLKGPPIKRRVDHCLASPAAHSVELLLINACIQR